MAGFNRIHLVGNLTRDPELRYTAKDVAVCDFGIAVNEKRKGQSETLFIDVTTFEKSAESVAEYLVKGRTVLVEGRLVKEEWTSKDNQRRSRLKIIASGVHFIGRAIND